MKILVTGGAGFIGSHLSEKLLAEGHDVVIIDNLSTGSIANLSAIKAHRNLTFIQGDILKIDELRSAFAGVEMVYHLAAAVGVKYVIDNPLLSIHTNVLGTENIFKLANEKHCKVIITSTSEIYGKNDCYRLREDADRVLGSTSITRWSYSSSKAIDEFMAYGYYRHYQLPMVIVRLFNTCGPRQSARYGMVIPRFVSQALNGEPITVYGTGEQTRAFTSVHDTVQALFSVGFNERCVGEVFNVGNEESAVTIQRLAEMVKEKTFSASPIVNISYDEAYEKGFEDMLYRVPDSTKLREYTGHRPRYGLDELLDETIEYMKGRHEKQFA